MKRLAAGARAVSAILIAAALATGCGATAPQQPGEAEQKPTTMQLLAVLPIEAAASASDPGAPPSSLPPSDAAPIVTAQIYRVLADQTEFRIVPDLTVADVVETPQVRGAGSLIARAVELGREVGADGVIFGRVFRFQKRVGTAFGATQPASVSFEVSLVSVSTGAVIWQGSFNQTQQPLTSNLLNWWMFWQAGPRWITASELAGLGVDRLFADMTVAVNRAS